MKHKLYNRLLSLALVLGLVAGMLPGVTFAGAVDSDATALQSQVEQIAEPTEEQQVFTAQTEDGVDVTVTAAPEVVPEGAQLEVEPLAEDSEAYTQAKAALEGKELTYDGFAALDIRFMLDGQEVEPTGEVEVSINAQPILPEDADVSSVAIYHLKEDAQGQVAEVEEVATESNDGTTAFSVDSFSTFTITWSSGWREQSVDVTCYDADTEDALPNATKPKDISLESGDLVNLTSTNTDLQIDGYTLVRAEITWTSWFSQKSSDNVTYVSATYSRGWYYSFDGGNSQSNLTNNISINLYYEETPSNVTITDTIFENGSLTAVLGENISSEGATYYWEICDTQSGTYQPVEEYVPTDSTLNGISGFEDGGDTLFVARAGARMWFKVTVTTATGEEYVSAPFQVEYYNSLQNGSFETPTRNQVNSDYQLQFNRSLFMQIPNGTNGLYWRTTAYGEHYGNEPNGYYIEIVNSNPRPAYGISAAAEGNQFAELNCEEPGALYQDVLTVPGSTLYWGLEHASRNNNYSTMAVVISDTESLPEDWNPADTDDLADREDDIQREITSNVSSWTRYTGTYTVPEGQYVTRFYFVATNGATEGNLLDAITFGKDVPQPAEKKGNLTIAKDVTEIEDTAVEPNTFTFTVTNEEGDTVGTISLPDAGGNWQGSLLDLEPGEYTITENAGTVQGYTCTGTTYRVTEDGVSGPVSSGKTATVTIAPDTQNNVDFINAYSQDTGSIKIEKTFVNLDDVTALNNKLQFVVTGSSGNSQTVTFDTEDKNWKLENGVYSYTIDKLPVGTYKVEEVNYDIKGYIWQGDGNEHTPNDTVKENIKVTKDNTESASFTNTYTPATGKLTITKVLDGEQATNGKPVFDFKITEIKDNGTEGTVYYVHIDMSTGDYDKELTLPAGTYKVEELGNLNYTQTDVEGLDASDCVKVGGSNQNVTVTFTNTADDTKIPSDGSATQNTVKSWDIENNVITWNKEDLGADPAETPEPSPTPEN